MFCRGKEERLRKFGSSLQVELQRLINTNEIEPAHLGQVFMVLGALGSRFPLATFHNLSLLQLFFQHLESASPDLRLQIREGLLSLVPAYRYDVNPNQFDSGERMNNLIVMLKRYLFFEESTVRSAAVRSIGVIFPNCFVESTFLLLLATGDR